MHIYIYASRAERVKCVIVYLARDIPAFVMYCVNGASSSSLLIESTYSMMESTNSMIVTHTVRATS